MRLLWVPFLVSASRDVPSEFEPLVPRGRGFCLMQNETVAAPKSFLQRRDNPVVSYVKGKIEAAESNPELKMLPFDGYFEMGCFADSTPEALWVKSPKNEAVTPKQCFNFCRDKPEARFFGLTEGRVCYCVPYPTLSGGNGGSEQCTAVCSGDNTQFCGGMVKSSIYEMHRCGDVTEAAEKDKKQIEALVEKWVFFTSRWEYVVSALTAEGEKIDVADIRQRVFGLASELEAKLSDTKAKVADLNEKLGPLDTALKAFSPEAATSEMMRDVEDAQAEAALFVAALEESAEDLRSFWDQHNLDGSMAFRSIDSKALADELSHLSTDVNFMPKKVIEAIGCDGVPADGCDDFPDKLTYFVVGKKHLASLFQVYNPAKPIEGRPQLSSAAEWKVWATKECHQMCIMTPGCVGGNAIGSSAGDMYAFTCNLKGSVEVVALSKTGEASDLMNGFLFGSYYSLHQKDIKYRVADIVISADGSEQPAASTGPTKTAPSGSPPQGVGPTKR